VKPRHWSKWIWRIARRTSPAGRALVRARRRYRGPRTHPIWVHKSEEPARAGRLSRSDCWPRLARATRHGGRASPRARPRSDRCHRRDDRVRSVAAASLPSRVALTRPRERQRRALAGMRRTSTCKQYRDYCSGDAKALASRLQRRFSGRRTANRRDRYDGERGTREDRA
jgi:hypothetical protein